MRRGMLARVVQAPRHRLVERLDRQRRFPAARHAGDADEGAERHFGGDVLQIVARGADKLEPAVVHGTASLRRQRDLPRAGEILARQARWVAHDVRRQALGHDFAAMDSGAGPHVDDVVGGADRFVVVLDHDHRVAEIAQSLERSQQPLIVALMQPDRRLVQHVKHAREAGADLRRQPDALAFAARQRARRARQRQIFQTDIVQERQAGADFLEHARRDLLLLGVELRIELGEPLIGRAHRKLADLADMQAGDLHAQRLGFQPVAAAHLARALGLVAFQLLLDPGRIRFLVAPLHVGDDALERLLDVVAAHAVVIGELDLLFARAEQDHILHLLGQFVPRRVQADLVVAGDRVQRLRIIGRRRFRPGRDRALAQRQRAVRHHELRVEIELHRRGRRIPDRRRADC